ncbi:hypothetical protein HAHE_08460 [Haloferula helveola]|uniref:Uncharacterized protein n=1 Tax=Haloferula helveola TaxID=490095 RepID=A0ABM7RGV2_9BACT|nr:hypothetical protein HAHE_08460 [Haloferula helveola]
MKQAHTTALPDIAQVETELSFEDLWDSAAVSDLIRSKSSLGETPAFLFLGRREAELLRGHLAAAFGSDAVTSLKGTYYMGLEVIEIDCDTFLRAAGRKTVRTLQDPIARRPDWRDRDSDALWQFRLR